MINELNLSKWDFRYFAERYCVISAAGGQLAPFKLLPSQEKLLARCAELEEASFPQRIGQFALIIAKARRVGATVFGEAAIAHNTMFRSQAKALVASCEPTNSLELFKILLRIYNNLPLWMKPVMTGQVKGEHLYFDSPLDSDILIGHGAQKNPMGQGVRLDAIHLTEMSTWQEIGTEQVDADILPAFRSSQVPASFFLIESTGENTMSGHGMWFRQQYEAGKANKGDFRSIFLSWYDRPDIHTTDSTGVELGETTLAVAERIKRDTGYACTKDQLAWYQVSREQYEEKGKLDTFLREYSSSDDECFRFGMPCAWPIEILDRVRNDLPVIQAIYEVDFNRKKIRNTIDVDTWDKDHNNRILIWEPPKEGFTYVIGVDAAYGEQGKDSSAIFVNRVGNRMFPDKQVAEFWSNTISPADLAGVCWMLGHIYTDRETGVPALMAIEANPGSPGIVTQSDLIKMNYPNFYTWRRENSTTGGWTNTIGWYTTGATRPLLTKRGVRAITDKELSVSSPYLLEEMKTFVNYGFKHRIGVDGYEYYAHAQGEHDDIIFAAFIAFYVSHDYDRMNVADERRKFYEAKLNEANPKPNRKDYQNTDMSGMESWDDIQNDWEERFFN